MVSRARNSIAGDVLIPPDGLVKLTDKKVPVVEQVKMGTLSAVLSLVSIACSALPRPRSSQLHCSQLIAHSSQYNVGDGQAARTCRSELVCIHQPCCLLGSCLCVTERPGMGMYVVPVIAQHNGMPLYTAVYLVQRTSRYIRSCLCRGFVTT